MNKLSFQNESSLEKNALENNAMARIYGGWCEGSWTCTGSFGSGRATLTGIKVQKSRESLEQA